MDQTDKEHLEYKIRLDATMDELMVSSSRIRDVVFAGSDEAVVAALANLCLARVRFLAARDAYREVTQLTA